ncbi:polyketide synthase [Salinactinospora qingdaonensis]|uniref:Polyketide synthase n=1 Tax=Salinactinospora qingdaonensis TaxID=702744 RepID=A0ABP7G5M9_9ACTN
MTETVVDLSWEGPTAVVTMADTVGRNTFSPELSGGLVAAVEAAAAEPRTRVVLVEGLPELFCAGGRQAELLDFAKGRGSFDEDDFFRIFLRCPLPVVAAVQGHAIGGGLVMALYADLLVLSERSIYTANFMRYGFTPGMGATHVLPAKLGALLGQEMLYTGRNYRGAELRRRGAPPSIVAHSEVPRTARELASTVAQAPRGSLELLKKETAAPLAERTESAIARETEMHRVSFHLPEVHERISTSYGGAR